MVHLFQDTGRLNVKKCTKITSCDGEGGKKMLRASGICKSYGKRRIIEQAEFFAGRGSCVGVVGANGCGKTTLLSILAGTRKADRGSVKIDGEEALGHPSVFARNVAYVPQENPLMEELTVRDNLLLWHRGNKKQMNEDLKRVPRLFWESLLSGDESGKAVRRNEKTPQYCLCSVGKCACPYYG